MPEVSISIGGRQFEVSCQEGEEDYLHAAAKMLDDEAQVLSDQVGRMPEARMLLMAGLLLADKTASVEDKIKEARPKSLIWKSSGCAAPMRSWPMPALRCAKPMPKGWGTPI